MTHESPKREEGAILNVVGEKVALGPLSKDLLPLYQRWINDLENSRNLGGYRPFTFEQEEEYYAELLKSGNIHFAIYERETLEPVGTTTLTDIDYRNRKAEFGILIGEKSARGKGLGTETTKLVLDYAFNAVELRNVMLRVFSFNEAGLRAYEKAGFKEFGRRRESYFTGGEWWNEVHMDCVSTDFESPVFDSLFAPFDPE